MTSLLPDGAVAAAYLRRLGLGEADSARHVAGRPLEPSNGNQALLSELARRHVLRVPFENLEQHAVPSPGGGQLPPTPPEERLRRLASGTRAAAERLAFSSVGGVCFDLNLAFVWLLRQLGASARLCMARVAKRGELTPEGPPSHTVILVDVGSAQVLVDPGFGDPPRVALPMTGDTFDGLASYQVAENSDEATSSQSFSKVLKVKRESLGRGDLHDLDDSSASAVEAEWTTMYCFRTDQDLGPDSEELRTGLEFVLSSEGSSPFAAKHFVCLGLPTGHVTLSARRFKRVEATSVVEEQPIKEGDTDTWCSLAARVMGMPLLTTPLDAKVNSMPPASSTGSSNGYKQFGKALSSQQTAATKAKNLGTMDNKSIAVGGAGAGGGLGLNRPGFGPKVQHFSGGNSAAGGKNLAIDDAVRSSWMNVMEDGNPMAWIYCVYTSDGKGLELKGSGTGGLSEFKSSLGDSIAWGGFRCYGVDKRGNLECKRPKFIFVEHKPEHVSAIKKARQGSHKGDVKEVISGTHVDLVVESLDDLDEQALITKLQAATGAHKPNGYEFDTGVFVEADFYGLGIGKQCTSESSKNT